MEAKFQVPTGGVFQEKYQRNNKKGGIKNLRCFPTCTTTEHRKGAPCTGPIIINVDVSLSDPKANLVAYARFRLDSPTPGEDWESDLVMYKPGDKYSKTEIDLSVRTRQNQLGKEFVGEPKLTKDSARAKGTFAFKERGWHYGWTGGRYKTNQQHFLEVNFFEINPSNPGVLVHVGLIESTRFFVFSSRRSNPEDKVKRRVKNKAAAAAAAAQDLHSIPELGKRIKKESHSKHSHHHADDGDANGVDDLLNQLIDLEDNNIPIGSEQDEFDLLDLDGDSEVGSDSDINNIDLQFYLGEITSPKSEFCDDILRDVGKQVISNAPTQNSAPLNKSSTSPAATAIKPPVQTFSPTATKTATPAQATTPKAADPAPPSPRTAQAIMKSQRKGSGSSTESSSSSKPATATPSGKATGSGMQNLYKDIPLSQQIKKPAPAVPSATKKDDKSVGFLTRLFRSLICH